MSYQIEGVGKITCQVNKLKKKKNGQAEGGRCNWEELVVARDLRQRMMAYVCVIMLFFHCDRVTGSSWSWFSIVYSVVRSSCSSIGVKKKF